MARKNISSQTENNTASTKRDLIASLELLRNDTGTQTPVAAEKKADSIFGSNEVYQLRNEVKKLRSLNILLESDLKNMEQKALDAISEAGRFRELLDKARDNNSANETKYYAEERQAILCELRHSRHTHAMLTQAVIESENEIARLTKTIEKLSMHLLSA